MFSSGIWSFGAGLSLFIFAISELEDSLKGLAGRPFKKFLHRQTSHPLRSVAGGAVVTALLQSSSVVLLLTLSFVGAGVLSTRNALAIVLGSNIGTTLDSWLIAWLGFRYDIESFAFPLLTIALLFRFFRRDFSVAERWFRLLIAFGILFTALSLMKSSMGPQSSLRQLIGDPTWHPYACVIAGFLLTSVIQSSFATVAISLSALDAGVFTLPQAAGLVVGAEAGTAIKFLFGVNARPVDVRRLAWGNFLVNVVTVIMGCILLQPATHFLSKVIFQGDPLSALVGFQTSLNILSLMLFFPFLPNYARWLERRIPDEHGKELDKILPAPHEDREPSYDELRDAVSRLMKRSESLIRHGLGANDEGESAGTFLERFTFWLRRRRSFMDEYRLVKGLHGSILEELSDRLAADVTPEESERWTGMVDVARNLLHASKTVKDIRPNIKELSSSANDDLFAELLSIRKDCTAFFRHFYSLADTFSLQEELESNRQWHSQKAAHTLGLLQNHRIKEYEASTLMNVHHEIYSSRKAMLRALSGIVQPGFIREGNTSALEER